MTAPPILPVHRGGSVEFVDVRSQTASYPSGNNADFVAATPGEQVNVSVAVTANTGASGGGNLFSNANHDAGATVCVTYVYSSNPDVLLGQTHHRHQRPNH